MDTTFRMRRYYRNVGAATMPLFLAWAGLAALAMLPNRPERLRPEAVGLTVGVPLAMAGLSLWLLVAYWREQLTVRGGRILYRGITRRREIDLGDVKDARWGIQSHGGSVVLRGARNRLTIHLGHYEDGDRDEIVNHLRSWLQPEVQSGWELFEYKIAPGRRPSVPRKPGPDEVLVRRDRWDRYFAPTVVVMGLAGLVAWYVTRGARFLIAPLLPLALWALLRASTPVEGMVARKLRRSLDPDSTRFLWFILLWGLAAVAGMTVHGALKARLDHPDAVLVTGAGVWMAVLLVEAILTARRQSRRDREAAEAAVKERRQGGSDPWPTE